MMYPVYTYHDGIYEGGRPDTDLKQADEQYEMISHWKRSWAKHGWNPKVLTQADARRHPMFQPITERLKQLPTVNSNAYELACYHRWLAVAVMGGGFMSDYDVVNFGFEPRDPQSDLTIYESHFSRDEVTPSCVSGTAYGFMSAVTAFAACDPKHVTSDHNGKPHTSDMIVLQKLRDTGLYVIAPIVRSYGNHGWETAPLVHYSHAATAETERVPCMRTSREI